MSSPSPVPPRRRLPREERTRQLLEVAWQLIGDEGTNALTLGRLAEAAGVTKPVVYDHFGTRNGLLAALYQDYDERQTRLFDAAIDATAANLQDKSRVIAASYVNCVLTQGREISDVVAALTGSPELAAVKKRYQHALIDKCAAILAPFCARGALSPAGMWAMLGAADSLSDAAVAGDISEKQAQDELQAIILGLVERSR